MLARFVCASSNASSAADVTRCREVAVPRYASPPIWVALGLVAIDRFVVGDDLAREIVVAIGQRLHRERDLLFAASTHRAEPLSQRAQLVLELFARMRRHHMDT